MERRPSVDEEKARKIWKCEDRESTQRPDSDVAEKECIWLGHCKWTTDEIVRLDGM